MHNEGKFGIAERTLKHKIYKYTTSISNNLYIDKYNNIYHNAIEMKFVYIKSST